MGGAPESAVASWSVTRTGLTMSATARIGHEDRCLRFKTFHTFGQSKQNHKISASVSGGCPAGAGLIRTPPAIRLGYPNCPTKISFVFSDILFHNVQDINRTERRHHVDRIRPHLDRRTVCRSVSARA